MGKIDGVCIVPLKLIRNERGRLMEIQRRDDSHFLLFWPGLRHFHVARCRQSVVSAWPGWGVPIVALVRN
jgi:dTDP-4-dehydrorhamnose 3,5-epimerase